MTLELREAWQAAVPILNPAHQIIRFPGGEMHVKLEEEGHLHTPIAILRGATSDDLFALAMWADMRRRVGPNRDKLTLFLPYLPGARMDRGAPLGAKVYADFINSLNLDRVITIDPHSDVAPALYDRLTVIDADKAIAPLGLDEGHPNFHAVIAPDLGATKRAQKVARYLGVHVHQAVKERDFATGALSKFRMLDRPDQGEMLLIVDDICDGGGTFLGLADYLDKKGVDRDHLGLWTTHGIYSKGALGKLAEKFSWIGSTDSHPGAEGYSGIHTIAFTDATTHVRATYAQVGVIDLILNEAGGF